MKPIIMPKAGQTMEEGLVLRWFKREGQPVEAGEVVLEVETDKAVIEIPSEETGILRRILVAEGQRVPVTVALGYVGAAGEPLPEKETTKIEALENSPHQASVVHEIRPEAPASTWSISPRARRLAAEHRIDLGLLSGSGPGSRITESDVAAFLGRSKSPTARQRVLSRGQQATGKLLQRSVQTAPHFFLVTDVEVEHALELRDRLKTSLHVTITDLIVKAAGLALVECPEVNCRWEAESIVYNDFINVGIAVDVDGGLLTATIAQVDKKPLSDVAMESRGAIERAKRGIDNGLPSSLTISNMGMYGVRQFTAIIPPPEIAILAVGEVSPTSRSADSAVNPNGIRKITFTLSCDHRALNGTHGARFLQSLKANLEHPEPWLDFS